MEHADNRSPHIIWRLPALARRRHTGGKIQFSEGEKSGLKGPLLILSNHCSDWILASSSVPAGHFVTSDICCAGSHLGCIGLGKRIPSPGRMDMSRRRCRCGTFAPWNRQGRSVCFSPEGNRT